MTENNQGSALLMVISFSAIIVTVVAVTASELSQNTKSAASVRQLMVKDLTFRNVNLFAASTSALYRSCKAANWDETFPTPTINPCLSACLLGKLSSGATPICVTSDSGQTFSNCQSTNGGNRLWYNFTLYHPTQETPPQPLSGPDPGDSGTLARTQNGSARIPVRKSDILLTVKFARALRTIELARLY